MKEHKFKIGNKVRILESATSVGVEREDVGKTGIINYVNSRASKNYGINVDMDEVCRARGYKANWSVGYGMIELLIKKGQQLEFSFMEKEE